jgi:hypothetical protein
MSYQISLVKKIALIILMLISSNVYSQEIQIKLVSENEGEPLPYRQALFKPSNFITSTDDKGIIKIDNELYSLQESIIISGFGLNDTTVFVSDIGDEHIIKLSLRDFLLPKIQIEKKRLKPIHIGSKEYPIEEILSPIKVFNNPNGKDYKYTTLIDLPRAKEKFITEVNFYVSNIFIDSNPIEVNFRVLASLSVRKLKEGIIYNSNDFVDLASEPIQIMVNTSGWNKLNFPNGIYVSREIRQVFLVFDNGRESDFFAIPYQNGLSSSIHHGFYFPPGEIGIFNKSSQFPAVFLELLID